MITRRQAIAIIRRHGIATTTEPTAWWPETGKQDPASSFDAELGVKPAYSLAKVKAWLGY